MAKSITSAELRQQLKGGQTPCLLDVRRKADYEASPEKIAGAQWVDPERFDTWLPRVPAGRPVVAYCVKGGAVSRSIAERLEQEGHAVAYLEGGMAAWSEQGNPVEET